MPPWNICILYEVYIACYRRHMDMKTLGQVKVGFHLTQMMDSEYRCQIENIGHITQVTI